MITAGTQVEFKKALHNGNLIRIGNVVRVNGNGMALVNFPIDHSSMEIPVEQLTPTSERFSGRASVDINALRRRM